MEARGVVALQKTVVPNSEAQRDFLVDPEPATAYIGGVGSGKTFAGIVKGLVKSQLPLAGPSPPRGAIGASSFGVLKKVMVPQFFEVMDGAGLWKTRKRVTSWVKSEMMARLIANCGCPDPHSCDHEANIYLVSLDDPDEIRGMELTWFYIDEGRNTTGYAWEVLWGRLRQKGYEGHHAGWVCSTSNGYDWMWERFSAESSSEKRIDGAHLYVASSMANVKNTGQDYIDRLRAQYHGRFFEQEVLGRFVGMTEGAVFFEFDPKDGAIDVPYRPDLPLYSEWDFGMGDQNVVLFMQLEYIPWKPDPAGRKVLLKPVKRYVGAMEQNNTSAEAWARLFMEYCDKRFDGRRPAGNIGDPAGRQRHQSSGKSTIEVLGAFGVDITPAPQRPVDYAVNLHNNMMADHRILVDQTNCLRLAQALSSHRWPVDKNGQRKANLPVHDWSSHYCDASRYGTTVLIEQEIGEEAPEAPKEYQPGTMGHIRQQIEAIASDTDVWLGPQPTSEVIWTPGPIVPRSR